MPLKLLIETVKILKNIIRSKQNEVFYTLFTTCGWDCDIHVYIKIRPVTGPCLILDHTTMLL
jgi:hypothetical protein